MSKILIKNGTIVNEGSKGAGFIVVKDDIIEKISLYSDCKDNSFELDSSLYDRVIDADGCYVMAGVIDDQVHFRQPGLTHKADIKSESCAALAGGVTSYMEMPNTTPPTTTLALLEDKNRIAESDSYVNYSFYIGATNDNFSVIESVDPTQVCGVKVFMGSSTGNMLVDKEETLKNIFRSSPILVATHCEDEATVKANLAHYKELYGDKVTATMHPDIRSAEACYKSSAHAAELAYKYGGRLHILHLSSAKEMELLSSEPLTSDKKITGEVCVHHLWFDKSFYQTKGNLIKWNPAVKSIEDRDALREGVISGKVDVVATDHAPHLIEEKLKPYLEAPSGGPLVQHSLVTMCEMAAQGVFSIEMVAEKMAHSPAKLFGVEKRGFLREGYFADITIVRKNEPWSVTKDNILYKCGWSPFEGDSFTSQVAYTIVNGVVGYENGTINHSVRGKKLTFKR